jgi:transposase
MVPHLERPKPAGGQFEDHREVIIELITRKGDPLKPKTAYEVICHQHGVTASYSSFKRFIRRLEPELSGHRTTCRIEVDPGTEIQIDYAKMGVLFDPVTGRSRTVYAFLATLSHSRYKFLEFVYTQNQQSFVGSHVRMFAFYGGTATCLIIDNLKSGVIRPDHYDPELNPLYRELAENYGTFIDTARVRRPTDKGKIERVVPPARELFRKLKTLDPKLDVIAANRLALEWCRTGNGLTVHGTTGERPSVAFAERERSALGPLPQEDFEVATWKKVKVHPDQFIQFEKRTFSVPERFVGATLWARGTERLLTIFDLQYRPVKQHVRTGKRRSTDWADFPEGVAAMCITHCVEKAVKSVEVSI